MKNKIQIAKKILAVEDKLNSAIATTLWVSDLHGEGDKFAKVLRESFGTLFQTCKEALPHYFSEEKILYIAKTIKKKEFIPQTKIRMDNQDVIHCLVDVLKYKIQSLNQNNGNKQNIAIDAINRLLVGNPISNLWYENNWFHKKLVYHLCEIILKNFLNRLIILGDIFDRGTDADKIIKIMNIPNIKNNMDLILGNHDILWMGACAGNLSLIMEAMRITCRYNHQNFLKRIGINYERLQKFALQTYPPTKITGNYKATEHSCRSMEKALSIIQFKLEEKTIEKYPQYEMQPRLWLNKLVQKLANKSNNLLDTDFPTLDTQNPSKLSLEEHQITQDLLEQFQHSKKLKKLMRIFFEKGKVYHNYNSILSIHALIPSNKKGEFEEFLGYRGKELLDYIYKVIQRVGKNYLAGRVSKEADLALFFYLWCGPKSPFFGKNAMKTFERYFIKDQESHKETTLYWETNLNTQQFQKIIKNTFFVEHVVFGHTPINYQKVQKITSKDGFAINIDGGFAQAYLNRGHALVQTPKKIYGIILHQEAEKVDHTSPEKVEIIRKYSYPLKVKNTSTASILQKKINMLLKMLAQ